MENNKQGPDISVVAPCYNEEKCLGEFVGRVESALRQAGVTFEIIIVNDGSRDGSLNVAMALAEEHPAVKVLDLSRNFGHQAAVTAGMDYALGRAVVVIDADLQDPPEVIIEMIRKWREGIDVVYGQRKSREGETFLKLFTAKVFYRLLRYLTRIDIPVDTGDFRLMDRNVVEAVKRLREHHRFIRGMISWVGFKQAPVSYDRKSRYAGETKYPLRKMINFSVDAITSFSVVPLRLLTIVGFLMMSLSVLYGLTVVIVRLFMPSYFVPGFAALAVLVVFFGGLNLLSLGLVGEYVGRIYEEVKGRPLYLVKDVHEKRNE